MKLIKNIYKDLFLNKKVHFTSNCEIAPLNVKCTVTGVSDNGSEIIFRVRSLTNGKTYNIGSKSKNLAYEFI